MEHDNKTSLLPHHEQQSLCTTRLPYRQGRKLTAVKAYSVTKESNHLLIFGVPSLNLRQELKAHFIKFGRLVQFNVSLEHPSESFTETYHAQYDKIQPARLAKRMLDTKNFYGGSLHVCYAPELENIEDTRQKLLQRQRDVLYRLKNLQKVPIVKEDTTDTLKPPDTVKVNMGEKNVIVFNNSKKRKKIDNQSNKRVKLSTNHSGNLDDHIPNNSEFLVNKIDGPEINNTLSQISKNEGKGNNFNNIAFNNEKLRLNTAEVEVVDCTSVDVETVTNINESLNYNKFGNEVVRKVPPKPLNKIKFNFNKN